MNKFFSTIFCVLILFSCTDIEEQLEDSVTETNLTTIVDPDITLDEIYNSLNGIIGDQANTFAINEVTTDAAIVPTRGSEWGDNGIWRQLHAQTWQIDHSFINNSWDSWNTIICDATAVIDPESNASNEQLGNAHFLRALAAYFLLDNFSQVPLCDPSSEQIPMVVSGEEAVDFISNDLAIAINNVSSLSPGSGIGNNSSPHARASKAAARYLLAKVVLNKHIYLNTSPDNSDMNQVISLVDEIENEGYSLVNGYFDIFRNDLDNETIWFLPTGVGNRIWNTLHYNQAPEIGGGGWNGFATLSEYYDLFEGDTGLNSNRPDNTKEERRGFVATQGEPFTNQPGTTESIDFPGFEAGSNVGFGFLIGQQFEINCAALTDRPGNPLSFTPAFLDQNGNPSLLDNSETTGIRVIKYNPRYGGFVNHEIFFRYSDAHLMRAEAILRNGGDATNEINELRSLRQASLLSSVSEQDILDERGRELYIELWRRNDLIRFGQFTNDWELKDPSAIGNINLNVFPIPSQAIIDNPNLSQNPGY